MPKQQSLESMYAERQANNRFHRNDGIPRQELLQQVPQTFVLTCSKASGNEVCAVRFASTKTFKEFQSSFSGKGFNFGPIYDRLVAQGLVKSNCSKQIADANPRLITQNPGAEKFWGWGDGFTLEIIENTFITVPKECVAQGNTSNAQTVDKTVAPTPAKLDTVATQPSHVDPIVVTAKTNEVSIPDYITAGIIGGAAIVGVAGAIAKNSLDRRARRQKEFQEITQQQLKRQAETSARLNAEAVERERVAEEKRKKQEKRDEELRKKK
ncbi:MAG: hypothetical protein HZA34_00560 [Candidatus Pacebacteria bacterium]|nr:hypothetical protein [Candidatus Paceibacterota bacterium]